MTFTFTRKRVGTNKSSRRTSKKKMIKFWEEKVKREAGGSGRSKIPNPKSKLVKLLYGEPKSPLYKSKVKPKVKPKDKPKDKPSEKTYIRFRRKKNN